MKIEARKYPIYMERIGCEKHGSSLTILLPSEGENNMPTHFQWDGHKKCLIWVVFGPPPREPAGRNDPAITNFDGWLDHNPPKVYKVK
jgi:hypothetical protein